MRHIERMFIILLLLLVPSFAFAGLGDVRVSLIEGDVQVRPADTQDWVPASINLPLREGDSLWVPTEGRVELQLLDGAVVRLDQDSSLDILRQEDGSSQFYLAEGSAYVNFRKFRSGFLQVDTPVSSMRAYEDAKFRVDVSRQGDTEVSVYRGTVTAENSKGRTSVLEGSSLAMGDRYADSMPLGRPDEWLAWNRDRDRRIETRGYSARYLPESLDPYAYDLDHYGRWVNTGEYGYVWTPTIGISVGWAPYRDGRWIWVGGDYVWISYDPWGWVPFHYGRWSHIASIGWCWIPPARNAVYWGPGYVGWVHTSSYVAWVPLAPGEIYYGYGYYGPHSVNVTNINIQTTRTKVVYKNVRINNAVTVINSKSFTSSRPVAVHVRENPFLQTKATLGRPLVRPERAAYMPISKQIPGAKLPPQSVREVGIKQLRQERPLVKDQRGSVMNPRAPEERMPVRILRERRAPESTQQRRETVPQGKTQQRVRPDQAPAQRAVPQSPEKGRSYEAPAAPQRQFQQPAGESRRPETPSSANRPEPRREQAPAQRAVPQSPEKGRSYQAPAARQQEMRRPETPPQRGVQQPPPENPRVRETPAQSRPPASPSSERGSAAPSVRSAPQRQQQPAAAPQRSNRQELRENRGSAPSVKRPTPPVEKKEKQQEQNTEVPAGNERPVERGGGGR